MYCFYTFLMLRLKLLQKDPKRSKIWRFFVILQMISENGFYAYAQVDHHNCFDVYWDAINLWLKYFVVESSLGCFLIMLDPHVSTSFTSPAWAPAPHGRCRIRRAFALGRVGARRCMASSGSAAGRIAGAVRPGRAERHRENGSRS